MNTLFALVVIFFIPANDGEPAKTTLHVVDRLNAEDCIAALSQHSTEDEVGVWGCTLDYDY